MGSSKSRLKRFMRLERIWISLEPDVILFSKIIIRQNANFIRLISGCRWFWETISDRLAAEIGRNSTYQLVITKNFGDKDLKDE
jgi:hypothetical protein